MKIEYGKYPPNYDEIAKAFHIKDTPNIVFTYGYQLFVPNKDSVIDKHLLEHEQTHALQQAEMGVEEWWKKYLADPGFRITQEVEAYRNQWRSMWTLPIKARAGYLTHICEGLSGAMYGNMVTPEEALHLITDGIKLQPRVIKGKSSEYQRKQKKVKRLNRKKGRR